MSFPTTLPSYIITTGAESANSTGGGTGLSGLLNAFETDITAIGTKVGTGNTTPAANQVLFGTGTGTSAWQGLTSAQLASILSDETGTGSVVFSNTPTIVTPSIASFTNAQHNHTNSAGGGVLGNGSVTNAMLDTSAGGIGAAYQSYTPTFGGGITLGNGTVIAYYLQTGKTMHYYGSITLGSTSTVGGLLVSLPVNINSHYVTNHMLGVMSAITHGAGPQYLGFMQQSTSSLIVGTWLGVAATFGTYAYASSTVPLTWTTGDIITWNVTYETV